MSEIINFFICLNDSKKNGTLIAIILSIICLFERQ